MKSTVAAIAASLSTAALLGLALANPRQQPAAHPKNVQVKLEWVQENPRVSESLVVSVDNGQRASVFRQMFGGKGTRQVSVIPRLEGDKVNLDLSIKAIGGSSQSLYTVVTVPLGETKVISAASTKIDSRAGRQASEELIFVTPSEG